MIFCAIEGSARPNLLLAILPPGATHDASGLLVIVGLMIATGAAVYVIGTYPYRRRTRQLDAEMAGLKQNDDATAAKLTATEERLRHETAQQKETETKLQRERSFMDIFLRSVPDAVYFKDEQSRFVRCSDSMACFFGKNSAEELIGKTDFDFFSEEHSRPAFEDEQKIIRTGQPILGLQEKEVFPDGRVGWSLTSKMPLRDETGKIVGTFGISKNMTDLKYSEEELRQREMLFRLIFEHAPLGVSWKRSDLGAEYHFNATFRQILDLPTDTMPDYALLSELSHPEDLPRHREAQRQIESGQTDSYTLEKRFVLKNQRLVWGRLSVAVVRDEGGKIIQEITILEDITARKRTEQELADTYKTLMEASRVAGMAEVATGVLHNVGNVLNSINVSVNVVSESLRLSRVGSVGKLSTLLHEHASDLGAFLTADPRGQRILPYLVTLADHLDGEQKSLLSELDSLRRNVDHIKDIVSMQQSYAKVSGVVEMLPPVDLFEDALRMNSAALSRHDIEVIREFAPTAFVRVERHKVLQILINVIRNAKYALDASSAPNHRLVLRIEQAGDVVRFIVSDNGVGIPPENITRIFSHGFTTRKDGHGFGLHSAALAAREMGGTLIAQSDGTGQGATFTLGLPSAPKDPAPAVAATKPAPAA
jgi:PAS domain S-box-containing protein